MPKIRRHNRRSSRRVAPPKDSDFDHEITLVNKEDVSPTSSRNPLSHTNTNGDTHTAPEPSGSRRQKRLSVSTDSRSGVQDEDGTPHRIEIVEGTATADDDVKPTAPPDGPSVYVQQPTPDPNEVERKLSFPSLKSKPSKASKASRASRETNGSTRRKSLTTPESAIDILYENQRGGFLCGIPLFSSKALGNLDPPAWTNFAHKPSPTDITNAQVPDPSWEWAWAEWRINHEKDYADEEGWEYSFAFWKKFSWHRPKWWNSFVRRRAWIRKRVKKAAGYDALHEGQDPSMLNPEYFIVRSSAEINRERSRSRSRERSKSRSPSRASTLMDSRRSRASMRSISEALDEEDKMVEDIENVEHLLAVLREGRIDREKIEAVDNYLEHADDNLEGLAGVMHNIMSMFIFQASRRALLARLTEVYDKAVEERERKEKELEERQEKEKKNKGKGNEENATPPTDGATSSPGSLPLSPEELEDKQSRREENLHQAVKRADEEVRRLEFWSDVKGMVLEGETKDGVDTHKGWDPSWQGVDNSGPAQPPAPNHGDAQSK
ncbi:hypothetical protein QBC32DRAFT_103978 [Pseudoneurospora amorphoporcata]|uniref:Meiotically up-regulated 65 protein n=1 Tax=Pseudoneurospora amorphoporcata TaxID=241081 RepID=A0AAN6NZT6_9PEZI|nr:hypothetical protein QBC32DRAFT_103978 [Pseudoneurospora amorphoporcata]